MKKQRDTIIVMDVGNSTVRIGLITGGKIGYNVTLSRRPERDFPRRLAMQAACFREIAGAGEVLISSVCPEVNDVVADFAGSLTTAAGAVFLAQSDIPMPVHGDVKHPEKIGIDRLLCSFAASTLYGRPCVVVGAGTAITVDLVNASGEFEGGAIGPGFKLSSRALSDQTSCVPEITFKSPQSACGRDTAGAVRSGVYHFCREGTAALIRKLSVLCGDTDAKVVVTGGDAALITEPPLSVQECVVDRELLLKGAWLVRRGRTE